MKKLLVFAMFMATTTFAQMQYGQLIGCALDSTTGKPISGAIITVMEGSEFGGAFIDGAETDKDGYFIVENLKLLKTYKIFIANSEFNSKFVFKISAINSHRNFLIGKDQSGVL